MDARRTFEDAARAARRLATVTAELEALDQSWRRGEWLGSGASWGGHSDPTSTGASYRMDRSEELEMERDRLERDVEEAQSLARGVGELLGKSHALALRYRYLENRRWPEVGELLGCCESTARNRVAAAFDTIDGLGPHRVRAAQGMATA